MPKGPMVDLGPRDVFQMAQPAMKVDVEYRAITAAGLLRHSVWKGVA